MICTQCGKENSNSHNHKFCANCGTLLPSKKSAKSRIIVVATICVVVAIAIGVFITLFGSPAPNAETIDRSTPEAVVLAYLEAFSNEDVSGMIDTFAIERFVDRYDLHTALTHLGLLQIRSGHLPNINDFTTSINTEVRRVWVMHQIFMQNRVLAMPDIDDDIPAAFIRDDAIHPVVLLSDIDISTSSLIDGVRHYLGAVSRDTVNIRGFISLEVLIEHFLESRRDYIFDDFYRIAQIMGADEITAVVVVFEMGDQLYLFFPEVARYDDDWYIFRLSGFFSNVFSRMVGKPLSHIDISGAMTPLPSEFYSDFMSILNPISAPIRQDPALSASRRAEGEGFDSPQEAIFAYLTALRNSDFEQMIRTFSIESYVDNIDFEAFLYSRHIFSGYASIYINDLDFEYSMNIERRRNAIANSISLQYRHLTLTNPDILPDPRHFLSEDDISEEQNTLRSAIRLDRDEETVNAAVDWMTERLYTHPLYSINLLGFIPYEDLIKELWGPYRMMTISDEYFRNEFWLGANALEGIVAVVEFGDEVFLFAPDTVRYGDRWYIHQLFGTIALQISFASDFLILEDSGGMLPIPDRLRDVYMSLLVPFQQ